MTSKSAGSEIVDRRHVTRVPFRRRVRLRFGDESECAEASTLDLSALGMFVETSRFRQPGETLEFEVDLSSSGDVIAGTAEVVRVRGGDTGQGASGMGIRFLDLRDRSGERIERIVAGRWEADRSGSTRR